MPDMILWIVQGDLGLEVASARSALCARSAPWSREILNFYNITF